ncbi:lectin-like domain-containing protein [Xylocopilactobacillus apicola]|uniref:MucBP domain-containing protein n=1 Tax=Xylocopilactobacillus apicola TaxID=2932184 RepID=A0AAU9DM91_9LACO|nr:MucBP domain-containing protein [Xylocopilactobacillus apicola]BDR59701.1 hypothetical protein XA3_21420 [Xylocopilactobacillus apicola]
MKDKRSYVDEKVHFKMYKSGKLWLVAGITTLALGAGMDLGSNPVKADSLPVRPLISSNTGSALSSNPFLTRDGTNIGNIDVTPANFGDYFKVNGDAKWDPTNATLTLTEDKKGQTGNATLKTKISVNDDFHLKGEVNLGNKSRGAGGADGIGIAFHTGENSEIGVAGGCLGLGGLPNGFGFKLDTYWNSAGVYGSNAGYDDDPQDFNKPQSAFGAFAHNVIKNGISTVVTYDGDDAKAFKISEPNNNSFLPIEADYSGTTHELKITYDGHTWTKKIDEDKWIPEGTTSLSFVISGSTGGSWNLQQFKLKNFEYTGYGVLNNKFVGPDGKTEVGTIPQANAKVGDDISLTDAVDKIKAIEQAGTYYFDKATYSNDDGKPEKDFDLTTHSSVKATEAPQTITYKFAKNQASIQTKPITMYEGDTVDMSKGFDTAKDKDGTSLSYDDISKSSTVGVDGNTTVTYSYTPTGYGNVALKPVTASPKINVIARKKITIKYVDANENAIDNKLLTGITEGDQTGAYGSTLEFTKPEKLSLNDKVYYEFDHAVITGTTETDLSKIKFGDNDIELKLYYKGVASDGIKVNFKDVNDSKKAFEPVTISGKAGDKLVVNDIKAPNGYHIADPSKENLPVGTSQPDIEFGAEASETTVYIVGDDIAENDDNALIVHYYLKDKNSKDLKPALNDEGNPVTVHDDVRKGGRVGQTITLSCNDQPTVAGHTLASKDDISYEFKPKTTGSKPGEVTFYYTADELKNIQIDFTDINNLNNDKNGIVDSVIPEGNHTGDKLDISSVKVPDGYHVASADELNGTQLNQPDNPIYKPGTAIVPVPVYVVGNDIAEGDNNAMVVHYYLKDKNSQDLKPALDKDNKPVEVKKDRRIGGKVGETINLLATESDQAVDGYTAVNPSVSGTLKYGQKPTEVTFYYTADGKSNIQVDFVNINGAGKDIVGNITPQNHFTGDELDLSNDPEIKSAVPNGYLMATEEELTAKGLTRPQNPTYGPQAPKENPIVYVVGKETTASNALTVHHKIKGPNNTETNVPGMSDITMNGRVGETIKVQPTAPIAGYTLASESKETAYKFKPDSTGDITFYYTAKEQSNVTINFVNAKNGKTVKTDSPKGKTGDTLDLTSVGPDSYIKKTIPAGYHYATNGELNGNSQPDKNLEFSTTPQTQTVYVAGDVVDGTSHASSRVTIHHYLKGTATPVPGMGEVGTGNSYKGGIIGDNVTVSPDDPEQKAPAGYTIVPNQQPDTWELTADGGHEVTYYYTADSIDNISIQFVNASDPTKKVGMPYIPSGHVTGDNLKVDSDEVKGHVPAGYHVASKAELDDLGSSLTQPELVYGVTSGVQTVYVIGEAQSNITVHFLDAKTLKELGTVTPKENPDSNSNPKASYRTGDVLKLDAASNYVSDFINAHTGYSYTSNSELSSMNLKQPENPTYTTQSQDINVYLSPQSKATHILKVIHKEQLPSTRGVRGLKDFQTSIEEGSDYDFDINDSAHKAPRGYTLIPGQESKLKGTMGTDGKEIILYYAKIR